MPEHVVRIAPDGTMTFIDKPELADLKSLGASTKRRASHVEPYRWLWRQAFHLLRRTFGESGAVATFTRAWPVRWRINLSPSDGPILCGDYRNRAEAIDAEIAWLQSTGFGARPPAYVYACTVCGCIGPDEYFTSNMDTPICPECSCPYLVRYHVQPRLDESSDTGGAPPHHGGAA